MKILNRPVLHPGKCIVCGIADAEDSRTFLDISLSIPRYGRVYFCSECFSEAFEAMGYIKAVNLTDLKKSLEELRVKYVELLRVHTELKDSVKIVLSHCGSDSGSNSDNIIDVSVVDPDEEAAGLHNESAEDDSGSSEFGGLEGLGSIHTDANDD